MMLWSGAAWPAWATSAAGSPTDCCDAASPEPVPESEASVGAGAAPDFAYGQVIWDSVSGGALFATMLGDEPQGVETSLHWGGKFMSLIMP